MRDFFVFLKNAMFGIVVVIWGLVIYSVPALMTEPTLQLLFISFTPGSLGIFFITAGILQIASVYWEFPTFGAFANILVAAAFLLVLFTSLYASVYMIVWVALAGIVLNRLINAFLQVTKD